MEAGICPNSVPYSDGNDTKADDAVMHDVEPNVSVEEKASRAKKADGIVRKKGFSSSSRLFRPQQNRQNENRNFKKKEEEGKRMES